MPESNAMTAAAPIPSRKRGRRWCPTPRKLKHFNKAWAQIAADAQAAKYGSAFQAYHCGCGWWHTRDRTKARAKDNAREPQNARRRRSKRGEPPPFQWREAQRKQDKEERVRERRRKKNANQRLRKRLAARLSLSVWEDDGGAYDSSE